VATTVVKALADAEPDQLEVYNVTQDPTELNNLTDVTMHADTVAQLAALLADQRAQKRLTPTMQSWTAGPSAKFRYPELPGGGGGPTE